MLYRLDMLNGLRPEDFADFTLARRLDELKAPTRLGERILPKRTVDEYVVGSGNISFRPVVAAVVAPGSLFPSGPLNTFSSREWQILKKGLEYSMNELEMLKMRDFVAGIDDPEGFEPSDALENRFFSLADALRVGEEDLTEKQRWACLAADSYTIPNTSLAVTWGIPGSHKYNLVGTAQWTDATNADGLLDLMNASKDSVALYGQPVVTWVMSTEAFILLTSQAKTISRLNAMGAFALGSQINATLATAGNYSQLVTPEMVSTYLNRQRNLANSTGTTGANIILYDGTYNEFDHWGNTQPVSTRFLPTNKVVGLTATPITGEILPTPRIGTAVGYYADGPVAENDFASGTFIWSEYQRYPLMVRMMMASWGLPIVDYRTIRQITIS